ncbi:DNA-directed RNA polymerase subunit beta [Marinicrinis lubricantis]|uniref:DNA-directed RNA polymerase subunit beta n=1 Tax=Marinicrinis lubricantis TaxID=2086470 RepID=A0ABW1IKD1_9BACL
MMTEREQSRNHLSEQPQTLSRVARSQTAKTASPAKKAVKPETAKDKSADKAADNAALDQEAAKPKLKGKHKGWVWFRRLIVPVLCIAALGAGMYAGYVVIGGGDASDVWKLDTWRHVFDLVFKD